MTPEEFRRFGHAMIDWIADYRAGSPSRPVMAQVGRARSARCFRRSRRRPASRSSDVLADLDRIVMPGMSHWQHPRFFGYFPANALLAGVLGDLASTGLGVLGLSWQSARR